MAHPRSPLRAALTDLALLLPMGLMACGTTTTEVEVPVASVTISFDGQLLTAFGATVRLSVQVTDTNGDVVNGPVVTWATSDELVVTVSSAGLATAIADGTVTITATVSGISGSATVTVAQAADRVVILSATTLNALGLQGRLSARVVDASGNALADTVATWSTSDPSIVSITEGWFMIAEANGTAMLSASIGDLTGTFEITVEQVATTVTLTPAADTLRSLAETVQMVASFVDANGFTVAAVMESWSSSVIGVATVSPSGLVSPVADGVTMVSVSVGGVSDSASILVSFDQLSSSLTIDLNLDTVFAEAGFIGTATVRNAVGVELTGLTLQWSASDPAFSVEYVRIDSLGRSTALIHIGTATGDFTIQAETDDGVTGSATVTVVAAPPAQGVTIDFETFPDGSAITCCIISTQFAAWGITFRWRDAFAGGGSGFPTLADYASPGFRALRADRRSTFEYLTGSHEMTFSVDIARFEVQVKLSTTAFPPPIRAYDRSGREIPGVVVERVVTVLGSLTFWELVIHAPVVIYRLKIGSTNGLLYLDDLVY